MGMRVLVVPDKFKGTLTAEQASEAMARGWSSARPDDVIELLPMSDGGDGFGIVLSSLLNAETRTTKTVDAAHRPLTAEWWWEPKSATAIIEAARVNGLAQLPAGKFHPFELDTFGIGEVLKDAVRAGAKRCVMGIGGSATNDGGFGVARAMGWEFFNAKSAALDRWTDLHSLSQIKIPQRDHWFEQFSVAVDVNNPLLGPTGCTRVYGPQKGLKETDFEFTERCLGSLATVAQQELQVSTATEPGAGAAGGLGFGLRTFLGAKLEPGFELFSQLANLTLRIENADLVITGEGAIDEQTLMGKGVGELAALCRKLNKPCIGLAGVVTDVEKARQLFTNVHSMVAITSGDEAKANASKWLNEIARSAAQAV
ncbi:MAG TPA: glycerate kinase [Candidatus Limnocylindria bacterium]|nr:glycerate kinase [Candidatus Limnocylindria bacterium]